MINHPNRAKSGYQRGEDLLRERYTMQCQWEMRGPKDTQIAMHGMFLCRVRDGGGTPFLVYLQGFAHGGFEIYTASPSNDLDATRAWLRRSEPEFEDTERRHLEETVAAIEKVTPNWRSFRDLAEAVEVAILRTR